MDEARLELAAAVLFTVVVIYGLIAGVAPVFQPWDGSYRNRTPVDFWIRIAANTAAAILMWALYLTH